MVTDRQTIRLVLRHLEIYLTNEWAKKLSKTSVCLLPVKPVSKINWLNFKLITQFWTICPIKIKLKVFKPEQFRKESKILLKFCETGNLIYVHFISSFLHMLLFTVEPTLICYFSYDCRTISNEKDVFKAMKKRLTNCAPSKWLSCQLFVYNIW